MTNTATKVPLGIRNNNPGNIDKNPKNKWQGLASNQGKGRFCVFKSPEWGIRALCVLLINYQDKYKLNTIKKIINKWAPTTENNTNAYIDHVSTMTTFDENKVLDVHNYDCLEPLVKAIITHENGFQPYDQDMINRGVILAGVKPPEKPLTKSRTVNTGATIAAGGTGIAALTAVKDFTEQHSSWIDMLLSYGPYAIAGVVVLGGGYVVYTRWSDIKNLRRM